MYRSNAIFYEFVIRVIVSWYDLNIDKRWSSKISCQNRVIVLSIHVCAFNANSLCKVAILDDKRNINIFNQIHGI